MSVITHERLHAAHRAQGSTARQRAVMRNVLRQVAATFIGVAIAIALVVAAIGLKSFILMSHLPLFH